MEFRALKIQGAYEIIPDKKGDERGFFCRMYCRDLFKANGLNFNPVQSNISSSPSKGTLRGMHFQKAPMEEIKVVTCLEGAVFDAFIDLRKESPTYMQWDFVELSSDKLNMAYIPEGLAHGFLTLTDNVKLHYQVSQFYSPELESGVRWDDPVFGIEWPAKPVLISEKDQNHPVYELCLNES